MASQKNMIDYLAQELHHWLWKNDRIGNKAPSESSITEFIEEFMTKHGHSFVVEEKKDDSKIPALLKKMPDAKSESKRMRELAGIPHKGNFV